MRRDKEAAMAQARMRRNSETNVHAELRPADWPTGVYRIAFFCGGRQLPIDRLLRAVFSNLTVQGVIGGANIPGPSFPLPTSVQSAGRPFLYPQVTCFRTRPTLLQARAPMHPHGDKEDGNHPPAAIKLPGMG